MKRTHGCTIVELILTIAVVAIMISLAVPAFANFVKNSQRTVQTKDLVGTFYMARTEAIKRKRRVTICKSDSTTSCNNAAAWTDGWIVFVDDDGDGLWDFADANADGVWQSGEGEEPLRIKDEAAGALTVTTANASIQNYVSYTGNGRVRLVSGTSQFGVLRICDDRGLDYARGVVVSSTGRVRSTTDSTEIGACP